MAWSWAEEQREIKKWIDSLPQTPSVIHQLGRVRSKTITSAAKLFKKQQYYWQNKEQIYARKKARRLSLKQENQNGNK